VSVGEGDEPNQAGAALDQGADRGVSAAADDQVALPIAE
jgi:hypothetical protein